MAVYKELGELRPSCALLNIVKQKGPELSDFHFHFEIPKVLQGFVEENGYVATEKTGMLFASKVGVGMHTDSEPAIIWFLGGLNKTTMFGKSHEFVIGNEGHFLSNGLIVWADTRKMHGVIAGNHSLWSCYAVSVKPIRRKLS